MLPQRWKSSGYRRSEGTYLQPPHPPRTAAAHRPRHRQHSIAHGRTTRVLEGERTYRLAIAGTHALVQEQLPPQRRRPHQVGELTDICTR